MSIKNDYIYNTLIINDLWPSYLEMQDFLVLKRIDQLMRNTLEYLFVNTTIKIEILKNKMIKLEEEGHLFEYVHRYSLQPLCKPFTLGDILSAVSSRQAQELWQESLMIPSPLTEAILTSDSCTPVVDELMLLETISEDFPWTVYRNNPIAAQAIVVSEYGAEVSPANLDEGLKAARFQSNPSLVKAILTSPYARKISAQEWALSLSWAFHLQHFELYKTILSSCETNSAMELVLDLALEASGPTRSIFPTKPTPYQPLLAQAILAHPKAKKALSPSQLGNALHYALTNKEDTLCNSILAFNSNSREILNLVLTYYESEDYDVKIILALLQVTDTISSQDLAVIFRCKAAQPKTIQAILSSRHANKITEKNLYKTLIYALISAGFYRDAYFLSSVSKYSSTALSILQSSWAQKISGKHLGQVLIKASKSITKSDVPAIVSIRSDTVKAILNSQLITKISDQDFQTAWKKILKSQHYDTILAFYSSKRVRAPLQTISSILLPINTNQLIRVILSALWRLNFEFARILTSELFNRLKKIIAGKFRNT